MVVERIRKNDPCIDIFAMFQMENKYKIPPSPYQDLADALGVLQPYRT